MTDRTALDSEQSERHIAGLVRRGGARERPSADAYAAVRAAVHREWQAVVAARARRRRRQWSAAAAASVAAAAVLLALPLMRGPAPALATVTRVSGPVEVSAGGLPGQANTVREGADVAAGSELRSGKTGRVALQVGTTSLRMDEQSAIRIAAADKVELLSGALYIDAAPDAVHEPLRVETRLGVVEHLGTQYETRLLDDALRVRIREGRVSIDGAGRSLQGAAGEQIVLADDGDVQRQAVAPSGAHWDWVAEVAPPFDIENRSLADFLTWVGRETGREVTFASSASEAAAAGLVLHGAVTGLAPDRALSAVLSTTDLSASTAGGRLLVDFRTGDR